MKKVLALVLSLTMVFTMMPMSAFAATSLNEDVNANNSTLQTEVNPELSAQEKLAALVAKADQLKEEDYTAESWKVFKEKRDQIAGDPLEMSDYVANWALGELQAGMDQLKEVTVQEKLAALVAQADQLKEENYTAESWKVFKEKRDQISGEISEMSEYVANWALGELQAGIKQLEEKGDKISIFITKVPNGTVTAQIGEKTVGEALKGSTVNLKITPKSTYELVDLKVVDAAGNEIKVDNNSFVMPETEVTITAVFDSPRFQLEEDGVYMVKGISNLPRVTQFTSVFSDSAKIVKKDGKYTITFYSSIANSWDNTGIEYFCQRPMNEYKLYSLDAFKSEPDAASKNLVSEKNASEDMAESLNDKVNSSINDLVYSSTKETLPDGIKSFSITTDAIPSKLFMNVAYSYNIYNEKGAEPENRDSVSYIGLSINKNNITKISEDINDYVGEITFNYELDRNLFRNPIATGSVKDGKLYVEYNLNKTAAFKNRKDGLSVKLLDNNLKEIDSKDGTITVVYDNIDQIIYGKNVLEECVLNDSKLGLKKVVSNEILKPSNVYKPLILEHKASGIKLYSTTEYIPATSELIITEVNDQKAIDNLNSNVKEYDKLIKFFTVRVMNNGQDITEDCGGGRNPVIEIPIADDINGNEIRVFNNLYYAYNDSFRFGFAHKNGAYENGK